MLTQNGPCPEPEPNSPTMTGASIASGARAPAPQHEANHDANARRLGQPCLADRSAVLEARLGREHADRGEVRRGVGGGAPAVEHGWPGGPGARGTNRARGEATVRYKVHFTRRIWQPVTAALRRFAS